MIGKISSIAGMTGYGHTEVRKSLDAGTETQESKDARFAKRLEIEATRVMPASESEPLNRYKLSEKEMQYSIDLVRIIMKEGTGKKE